MGGAPKGLLLTPDGEPVVVRAVRVLREAGATPVLVGRSDAYDVDADRVADAPDLRGPLAGLVALLELHDGPVVTVACDMPFFTAPLVRRLVEAPPARAIAARPGGVWQPFFARWDAASVRADARAYASAGGRSLFGLLERLGAAELPLSEVEARLLVDWDAPADVPRG